MLEEAVEVVPSIRGGGEAAEGEPVGGEVEDKGGLISAEYQLATIDDLGRSYLLWSLLELCHFGTSPPDQTQIKHLQRLFEPELAFPSRRRLCFSPFPARKC